MIHIIYSYPYLQSKAVCQDIKKGRQAGTGFDKILKEITEAMPAKSVLIPIPQHGGTAKYTDDLAVRIAKKTNFTYPEKTIVVLNTIRGKERDSVCERKRLGQPFDDIDFGFTVTEPERLQRFVDSGWDIIFVDNVIDTGTTIKAAAKAAGIGEDGQCNVIAIGDTGAWKNFEN